MSEVVHIQLGGAGNNISARFWEFIADEHGVDVKGCYRGTSDLLLDRINVYFSQVRHRYVPRSVLVDLEPSTMESIRSAYIGQLFNNENYVFGHEGSGNNWAKGLYTEGAEILDQVLDTVRNEAEACDCMQGFQLVHSVGGGTGGGMSCLLLTRLKEEYPERIISTFTVMPSTRVSDVVVEPYNCALTLPHLIESSDECYMLDNEAVYDISAKTLKLSAPSYADMNHLIATAMSGMTVGLRFPGQLNSTLRKIYVNLVPFPRLHFFIPGQAPMLGRCEQHYRPIGVEDLVMQMFDAKNTYCACDLTKGKYLACAALFRGNISTREVEELMEHMCDNNSAYFVDWIPDNVKSAIYEIGQQGFKISSTIVANTTSIQSLFKRVGHAFNAMYRRKAFLHWYTGEGMEEYEFMEASTRLQDLLEDYKQTGEMQFNDDEVELDEEEEEGEGSASLVTGSSEREPPKTD